MKRIFTGLYHLLWYTVAVVLILAAIVVTAARLSLPGIGSYKDEIQAWVSEYMRYPVAIEDISADWSGWIPNLHLQEIRLYSQQTDEQIAHFEQASLDIDLITSLWQGEIIPLQLSISGLTLDLVRKADGSVTLRNQERPTAPTSNNKAELAQWLINQRHIVLEQARISWKDEKTAMPVRQFDNVQLSLRADGDRHQLNASIILPSEYGNSLKLHMDFRGNPLLPGWSGRIYAEAQQIRGEELLAGMPLQVSDGTATIRLWTKWEETRLTEAYGNAILESMGFVAGEHQLPIESARLEFQARRENNQQWFTTLNLEDVKTPQGTWPASTHRLLLDRVNNNSYFPVAGEFGFIRLEDILPLLVATGIVPDEWQQHAPLLSIRGDMKNIVFSVDTDSEDNDVTIDADFSGVNVIDDNYQVADLDGSFTYHPRILDLRLEDSRTDIRIDSLFENSIKLENLEAALQIDFTEQPRLVVENLAFTGHDTPLTLSGEVRFDEASPFVDLIARMGETRLTSLPAFLPRQTHPDLVSWLNQAFIGGEISSGHVLFRGRLDEYPFDDKEGNFQTIVNIANATLNYKENWPYVENLTAELLINNDDLSINAVSGQVFDARIDSLNAQVMNLLKGDHHILVDSELSGHIGEIMLFINQSPLKENESLYEFATMNVAGQFDLDLQLDIPLGETTTTVDGVMSLQDTMLESNMPGIGLENINGDIYFTRDHAWGTDINALYHGKQVQLSIPRDNDDSSKTRFTVNGRADKVFLIQQLSSFFPSLLNQQHNFFDYFDGESDWAVTIERFHDDNDALHRNIIIKSSLEGIAITLPEPAGKVADGVRSFSVNTHMVESRINQIEIDYDDLIHTRLHVDNSQDFKVDKITIAVGQEQEIKNNNGDIVIRGQLEELDLDNWFDFFNQQKDTGNRNNNSKSLSLELDVASLIMLDQTYRDMQFSLSNTPNGWLAGFDGTNIKGKATFIDTDNQEYDKLNAEFDYLVINKKESGEQDKKYDLELEHLPELSISISDFIFNEKALGKTTLITSNEINAINIDSLSFSKPGIDINGTGSWTLIDGINRSDFDIKLDADSLAGLLKTFSKNETNVEGGKTSMTLKANWMKSPVNFEMDNVNGELDIDIEKGQLLDLDPSAGRLLGLLSVTTLPRRLSLDFSDLFKKGFAFDRIEGSFSIQQGQAYTNDLFMTAPAANISISGRTGLVTEDYDQIATVMPKITSSLPVASALFGPIGVGVGTVIYLAGEVFESIPRQINKILSYQYSIRGSWDNPNIEKLEKDASPASGPEGAVRDEQKRKKG